MTTNARKTDAQRLGNGKKAFNVKQVEKMVEDAGGSYTAGDGITIADETISVDTDTIQEKLTAVSPVTINESNEIGVDHSLLLLNNIGLNNEYTIRLNHANNLGANHGLNLKSFGGTDIRIDYYAIKLNNTSGTMTNMIRNKLITEFGNAGFIEIHGKNPGNTSNNSKIIEMGQVKTDDIYSALGLDNSSTEINGIFLYSVDFGKNIKIGQFVKDDNNHGHFAYALNIDCNNKKVYISDGSTNSDVLVKKSMPAGKNVTDTVTFQDLINLGIIADPNA